MNKYYTSNDIREFKNIENLEWYFKEKSYIDRIEIYSAVLILLASNEELKEDEDYYSIIHNYILNIKNIIEKYGCPSDRLYGGITGIGFAILAISENGTRYKKLLSTINSLIFSTTKHKLKLAIENLDNVKELHYDVISGVAGDVGYLLNFKDDEEVEILIKECLNYLILLTEDIEINSKKVPRFFIKSENAITEVDYGISKYGFINQGLAHGIPSILSILALSLNYGIEVKNQKRAMEKIVNILCEFRYVDNKGRSWWYDHISFEQYISRKKPLFTGRDSWCYGTPGIARTLYLSSKLLDNQRGENIALEALNSLALEGSEGWGVDSVSLCHGYSSILAIMSVMYKDTGNKIFKKAIDDSVKCILKNVQPEYKFKFKDYTFENIYDNKLEKCYKEDLSILTGSIGVFLALELTKKENKYLERMLLIN